MNAGGAPIFSYFLNYNGLDRYNRQGITFVLMNGKGFVTMAKSGGNSSIATEEPQAEEARKRLEALGASE